MRIILFGRSGQVGRELVPLLTELGSLASFDRGQVDLEHADAIRAVIRRERPDVVVNAAASTAVDRAESDPEPARRVNADAVGVMAEEVARSGGWLIHYSTDYVFDGTKATGYVETDATRPLNVYGATKLAGERLVAASGCRHLIFRSSWVYAAHGHNFMRTVLRLLQDREDLAVVDDQFGAPTSAERIARVTADAVRRIDAVPPESGVFHLAAGGSTSWHGFALFIAAAARDGGLDLRVAPDRIRRLPSEALSQPARRPASSLLDTSKLRREFGTVLPDWRVDAAAVLTTAIRHTEATTA